MKLARYWPIAAGLLGVGLVYVVLAQADTPVAPSPYAFEGDVQYFESPHSPSDLPRLECAAAPSCPSTVSVRSAGACPASACATTACTTSSCDKSPCAATACTTSAACTASACNKSACTSATPCAAATVCSGKGACPASAACTASACPTACQSKCQAACETAINAYIATMAQGEAGEKCCCNKDCGCGDACACGKNSMCSEKCLCGKTPGAALVSAEEECLLGLNCDCVSSAVFAKAGGCSKSGACNTATCPRGAVCNELECVEHVYGPNPEIACGAGMPIPPPVPPGPYMAHAPFAPGFGAPMFMPPPGPPPHGAPMNHEMHDMLVEAVSHTARLQARDEAWHELQARSEKATHLAVENAKLQAQLELAAHKQKALEQVAEMAVKNAELAAKLAAVTERQELTETLMKVASEKALAEARVEMLEANHELHVEALNAVLETKQELLEPLHELLVENVTLKVSAEASEETHALKARIAELEQAVDATTVAEKSPTKKASHKKAGKKGKKPVVKTARGANSTSDTK